MQQYYVCAALLFIVQREVKQAMGCSMAVNSDTGLHYKYRVCEI